jgi:hypothetical protein
MTLPWVVTRSKGAVGKKYSQSEKGGTEFTEKTIYGAARGAVHSSLRAALKILPSQ